MTAARRQVAPDTRAMLAKVHLGAKQLGLDEETRRGLMFQITGRRSSADCTTAQLADVISEYRRLGWIPTSAGQTKPGVGSKTVRKAAKHPVALKARALWISLHQLGVVRDPGEKALEAFAARQLHVDRLAWADQSQGFRLIEALKKMADRAGWDQELKGIVAGRQVWTLKARLVNAQLRRLGRPFLRSAGMTETDLDKMAKALAVEIHALPAEGAAE